MKNLKEELMDSGIVITVKGLREKFTDNAKTTVRRDYEQQHDHYEEVRIRSDEVCPILQKYSD